jgi:hypothetical protein
MLGLVNRCDVHAHNKLRQPSEFLIPSQFIHLINIIYEAAAGMDQSDSTTASQINIQI